MSAAAQTFSGSIITPGPGQRPSGKLGLDQAPLEVALPGLEISDAALGLLARQIQLARDMINPHGAIFLLVVRVSGRFLIYSVSAFPFFFDFRRRLYTAQFWHNLQSPLQSDGNRLMNFKNI